MMKLGSKLFQQTICASQKQCIVSVTPSRKLHHWMCNLTAMRYLPGRVLYNRFRGRLLESYIVGMHLPRHWKSTSGNSELDMNKELNSMRINACSDLYREWHEMDVNRKMPLRGLDFDVVYFDSQPRAPSHVPVIVALHGTAGSHCHFAPLVPILMKTGARIIIPNFPGCGFTPMDERKAFLHTDQERASFVLDFLNALGISRVDVLVVHSAAIYPALYCLNDVSTFKSIVFLNPAGHKPVKSLEPLWFYQFAVGLLSSSLFRPLARSIMPMFARNMKLDFEDLEIAAKSLVFVNFEFVVQKLKDLKLSNFPMIFSYALNDKIVGERIFDEMAQILEFSSKETLRYDAEGKIIKSQMVEIVNQRPACIIFEDGGHFVMNAFPEIVGKAITDLLEWIKSRPAYVVPR